jgi:hypothetical protein
MHKILNNMKTMHKLRYDFLILHGFIDIELIIIHFSTVP